MKQDLGFDAVIFDLDGVITRTALVHSRAWKKMFDEFLEGYSQKSGISFREFSHNEDYLPFVDGKPRYKGVKSFLESRNIRLPYGDPSDKPDEETICGLGNRKNEAFNQVLKDEGVSVYESTVSLIRQLKDHGIRIGVASSSKNCKVVLEAAGLLSLFETRVDGLVSAEMGLHGKPEPDIFTTASDNLNVTYDRSVVVEDAVSGVQAGAKGNFGLVLGIAREDNDEELWKNGADIVVKDMAEISLEGISSWFREGLDDDQWKIKYKDFIPSSERSREALLTVGNGFMGVRGAMEECHASEHHYPGMYIAGGYNRLVSKVADRDIENEDLVNFSDWRHINFSIGKQGKWMHPDEASIRSIYRELDLRKGLLSRKLIITDDEGRLTEVSSMRFVSMKEKGLAGIRYCLKPLNYEGDIRVGTQLKGDIINDGVARYRQLESRHLEAVYEGIEGDMLTLTVKTKQSHIYLSICQKLDVSIDGTPVDDVLHKKETAKLSSSAEVKLTKGQELCITKMVFVSRSDEVSYEHDILKSEAILSKEGFDHALEASATEWARLWQQADVKITGDRLGQKLLRMHIYHLLVSASPHNIMLDASITARGLHGEAYRGHIFWDELYILPFYYMHFPDIAKAMLMYRYRRLDKAREYAREYGYKGAMYPWQSGSDGREETQVLHLNPVSGKWGPDYSSLQRHVSLAIAYTIIQYFHYTGDKDFMQNYGLEMLLEISAFWAGRCIWDEEKNRYSIKNVMGPDEFHEKYPDTDEGGLKDNAYTNLMTAYLLTKLKTILDTFNASVTQRILEKCRLTYNAVDEWQEIAHKLKLVINDDGIIAQYDGYFELEELDWDAYRQKYGNIYRMDRILKAEGKSADDYKVAKQADTLMTFYNLNLSDIDRLLESMSYTLPDDYLTNNLHYYLERTSHGSTLSRVVHSSLARIVGDDKLSWSLYRDALTSDYVDIQGGTTAEGIHSGVMAGTIMTAINAYAGVDFRGDMLTINPGLPQLWREIEFNAVFKAGHYHFKISKNKICIELVKCDKGKIQMKFMDTIFELSQGEIKELDY